MAIEFNDNIHVKINRPTDFRYGPFESTAQALSLIPIAQRYHGLSFGVYTTPLDLTTSDVDCYYFYNDLSVFKPCGNTSIPPIDGDYVDQTVMIADQPNQIANYIYYDGTSYWEYLGTTNGNITDYREIGGGGDIILYFENTYSQVLALSQAGQLVTGATYKITDYQTIHLILESTDIRTGPVEPLFVKALSPTEIDKRATSAIYPDDIIEYDFLNNVAENGTTPTKGLILFRHDLINNLSCFYDWREVVFRRWRLANKRQEEAVTIDSSTFQITTTYTTLSVTTFNTNARKIHTKVDPGITHAAGILTLTITNGTITYTRPLIKMNGSSTFSANELANRRGIIVNCNIRNVFIFWYSNSFAYGDYGFGNEVLGFDLSPFPGPTFAVGDGIVFEVDANIYQDLKTFDGTSRGAVYKDVHLGLRTQTNYNVGASRFNNTVFYSSATHVTAGAHVTNNIFLGNVTSTILENEIINSLFLYNVVWCHLMECVFSFFGNLWHAELNKGHYDRSTIYGSNFGHAFENSVNYSTIIVRGYGGKFFGWIWNSVVDITAASNSGNTTSFSCSTYLDNTILGQIDGNLADIRTPLTGRSFYQLETDRFATYMSSANLYNPSTTSIGSTQNIVIDESGNLVKVPFNNLSETTQSGNTSLVVIKHPDGVAPEDSATVGQLTAFGNQLEASLNLRTFGITIDGASNPITTGIKGYLIIPYNCEILAWYIVSDTVGSIEIDVWKAASIPTGANSICGTDRPKLVSVQENQNETLTLWTIGVTSGDVVAFNVISANTVTRVNLIIKTKVVV
jgi:acetyltransferase-like isoleucine patch superfamily enzyme